MNGANFTGNQAEYGGAIATATDDASVVTGAAFSGNSGDDGGAVYIQDSMVVAHCDFTGNSAQDVGGGIYVGAR